MQCRFPYYNNVRLLNSNQMRKIKSSLSIKWNEWQTQGQVKSSQVRWQTATDAFYQESISQMVNGVSVCVDADWKLFNVKPARLIYFCSAFGRHTNTYHWNAFQSGNHKMYMTQMVAWLTKPMNLPTNRPSNLIEMTLAVATAAINLLNQLNQNKMQWNSDSISPWIGQRPACQWW